MISTPHGIYSLNSHLKDSALGFTHSAPPKKSFEGGIRPKASEPPNKRKPVRSFSFLAGTAAVVQTLGTHEDENISRISESEKVCCHVLLLLQVDNI